MQFQIETVFSEYIKALESSSVTMTTIPLIAVHAGQHAASSKNISHGKSVLETFYCKIFQSGRRAMTL